MIPLPTGVDRSDASTQMKLRRFITGAWTALASSLLLIAWQLTAYLTDRIPGHILPVVRVLSGTQEAVPIAYTWTIWVGILSVGMSVASLAILICAYFLPLHRNERGRQV